MTNSEQWNRGGAVTESERNDRNMTDAERREALYLMKKIISKAMTIRSKLGSGAPCAAEKTLNDLDQASDFLGFVWERVKDWKK